MRRIDPSQLADIRDGFYARGETVVDWARRCGFEPAMVYQVLSGRCQCQRGTSHQIALALGLKKQANQQERALTSKEAEMQ